MGRPERKPKRWRRPAARWTTCGASPGANRAFASLLSRVLPVQVTGDDEGGPVRIGVERIEVHHTGREQTPERKRTDIAPMNGSVKCVLLATLSVALDPHGNFVQQTKVLRLSIGMLAFLQCRREHTYDFLALKGHRVR